MLPRWFPGAIAGAPVARGWLAAAAVLTLGAASALAEFGPRQRHTIIFDAARQRFVAFGGATQPEGYLYNDVWTRPAGTNGEWTPLAVAGTPPAPREGHSAIYDPVADRMIVYGGRGGALFGDLWQLTFSGTPQWSPLAATGASPGPREGHSAHYDALRSHMLVFGGLTPELSSEVWFLQLSGATATWQLAAPGGAPPPGRSGHVSAWDAVRQQLVVFGGLGTGYLADLWVLRFQPSLAWAQHVGASPTGGRHGASGLFDETGSYLYIFGGHNFSTYSTDLWRIDLSNFGFSAVTMTTVPPARRHAASASDPSSRLAVMHGGSVGTAATHSDTWLLGMSASPVWGTDLPTPALMSLLSSEVHADRVELRWGVTGANGASCRVERRQASDSWRTVATSALDGSGVVSFVDRDVAPGGRYGYRLFVGGAGDDALSSETWVDIPASDGFALHGFSPNPAMGRARVAFSASETGPLTLDLIDVNGRRVAHHRVESPSRGAGSVEIAPEGGLAPGIYFIRLTQSGRTLIRRGSVVE